MQRTLSSLRTALRSLPLFAGLFTAAVAGGCVLYGEPDDYKTCQEVACGNHASCGDGKCFCDPGYEGNPYTGCQDATPAVDEECAKDCGQNAYCSEGECYCELDHVYVCGENAGCMPTERLCDKANDCPNAADEALAVCSPPVFQEWLLTDDCDDGLDIEWRLFAQDRDWTWPSIDSTFRTAGRGVDVYQIIQCFEGEWICFAGASGDVTWGFNLDGTGECENCCAACGSQDLLDLGFLTCEG
ncbi:hypothetical protein [Nannocystis pusilla]|uniref:EGF-like domain-containing protein n=1 Tax=Nannocystis pusilla TaxID=889268 RepID=A0ABS7U1Y8_9BACT|nr:hypothetical protein [Nannocystis pusilla]MBZ5714470.1 hypothetical protein [Nannocystis pusilla]